MRCTMSLGCVFEHNPRGFIWGMSRALLTYRSFLHCCVWSIVLNPGFKKSNIQTLFTSPPPVSHTERAEEWEAESAGCHLSAKHAQTHTSSLPSLLQLHGFLRLCTLSGISHFPARHLTWLTQLPAIKRAAAAWLAGSSGVTLIQELPVLATGSWKIW